MAAGINPGPSATLSSPSSTNNGDCGMGKAGPLLRADTEHFYCWGSSARVAPSRHGKNGVAEPQGLICGTYFK